MYSAKILADSISPCGIRLTTMEVTFPRIILAEFNTHRMFSRNSSSSRAIPIEKIIQRVQDNPFIPFYWGKNQKGMQAKEELDTKVCKGASAAWLSARDAAVSNAKLMSSMGVHKQLANRLLEPWMWQTCIVSATEWSNFFALRCNKDAQPEIKKIADMMRELYDAGNPAQISFGQFHLPLVLQEEKDSGQFNIDSLKKISTGRCARVSYLTHDGKRDPAADIALCDKLIESGHMSPAEHVASPVDSTCYKNFYGNFRGWVQFRKEIDNEHDFSLRINNDT